MKKLIVLSLVLIAILVGCSSEREKTFQNPAEVIKALDKHNVTECNDLDAEPFLANKSVIYFIELGGGELKGVMFNISTYADIKQIDLFKDKCKKDDIGVFPDALHARLRPTEGSSPFKNLRLPAFISICPLRKPPWPGR